MQTPFDIATDYLALWNEASPTGRKARLDAWHPHVRYRDPLAQAENRAAVATMIEDVRTRFPGCVFQMRGVPDGHGPFARFSWTLGPDNGAPVAAGTDIVRFDDDGHLAEVIGFLDEVDP